VRGTLKQVLSAVFALATLTVIVEHAGGFSKVLEGGAGAFKTGYQTLVKV
jgi:hypothetical protein